MSKLEEIKLITLGSASVGKSSLIIQYTENKFTESYLSTLGVDYKQKIIKLKNGKDIHLRIYDTAGQERFKSISSGFIKKADGVVLVYDISNKDSFVSINGWIANIREIGKENMPIILVGNKCDLSDEVRKVSKKEGEDKAKEFRILFYETSCKDGKNVKESIEEFVEDISIKKKTNPKKDIKINKTKTKKKCC